MNRFAIGFLLMGLAVECSANSPTAVMQGAGNYDIRLTPGASFDAVATGSIKVVIKIGNDGSISSVKFKEFIELDTEEPIYIGGVATPPDDDDGGEDPPTPETDFQKKVSEAVLATNDLSTAQMLLAAYTTVISMQDEFSSVRQISNAARSASRVVYDRIGANKSAKWNDFKKLLSDHARALQQQGEIGTVDEYGDLLVEIQSGIRVALGQSAGLESIPFDLLKDLINSILDEIDPDPNRPIMKAIRIALFVLEIMTSLGMEVPDA